ncbi:MAG: DUF934 domain-containing protein [Methylomonas sp.]|nr:DUF934 domain-containing protein [Methylomonas sp.]PPD19344.1 MAG: oxidoreductase [Methylomonas sp.]PPD37778.1 MAG: oxidoreductase [Methylomonas sp.]PPD54252.1 MAG: oxidoreductase [Methylomonas sp.]
MPLIKNKALSDNSWTFVADENPLPHGDISVSLQRWQAEKDAVLQHDGHHGVRLSPADSVDALANDLDKLDLIELDFPLFKDGRCFSQARLLRDKYHYQGEIRAVGRFLTDQVFYLHRVGFNAFELDSARDVDLALAALNDFSVRYQASSQ